MLQYMRLLFLYPLPNR